ncbi:retrovirus-related pol polyprotein from transposon TNT 1-94 [Tanacetum coccineum]
MTSTVRTSQLNSVVERRNCTLVEAARTMLIFSKSPLFPWAEAVATACYTQNRSLIHTRYNKTPYELLRDRKSELKYLHVFDALSKPPTKNDWELLFQPIFDEYFKNLSVESNPISAATLPPPDTAGASSSPSTSIDKDAPSPSTSPNIKAKNSPLNSTNVEPNKEVAEFDTKEEPKNYKEAMEESCWIKAMQEEIHEFERIKVWELVPRPDKAMIISLKWIFKVKLDEYAGVLKNKARLIAKGLQISQSPRGIFSNQSKYALEMLKKYGLDQCDAVDIPMVRQSKLDEDPNGTLVDPTHYQGMVRSLMYLTASRPDLVFVVCVCAWYQAKPIEKHLIAVKRVFWYLKGTINMGLWYLRDTGFNITDFADADHAGCPDSMKSTSGTAQFLEEKLMRSQLTDYGFDYNKIPLYSDSQSAITLSCNTVQHSRTKHVVVRYHFIKEQVENGVVELSFVKIAYQLVDIFTKALARERF